MTNDLHSTPICIPKADLIKYILQSENQNLSIMIRIIPFFFMFVGSHYLLNAQEDLPALLTMPVHINPDDIFVGKNWASTIEVTSDGAALYEYARLLKSIRNSHPLNVINRR